MKTFCTLHLADFFNLSFKDMSKYKLFSINFVCLHKHWHEIG